MDATRIIKRGVAHYERFLRIDTIRRKGARMHARLIYAIAWIFILLQMLNWVNMYATYDGWHFQHLISFGVCIGLFGLTLALRVTRSRLFFGLVYAGLLLGAVALASVHAVNPLLGGGINTSLLPLLAIGPVLMALVSHWRMVVAYTLAALAMMVWMHSLSSAALFALEPGVYGVILPDAAMSFGGSYNLIHDQRLIQTGIAVLVSGLISAPFGHRLYALFEELEDAADQAQSSRAAKANFLAQMSHEIRTPLSGIVSVSEMLERETLSDQAATYSRIMATASRHLMEIVNEVLDHERLEAGRLDLHPQAFDLRDSFNDLLSVHENRARDAELWLGLDWQEGLPSAVIGDEARIRQVTQNLLSNALKFTREGGVRLGVRGAVQGQNVQLKIYVQDTGAGIEAEACERIFERFGQSLSGAQQGSSGTGLGLTITRELVELMGGQIGVTSTLGQGSVFAYSLRLPLDPAARTDEAGEIAGRAA